MAGPWKNKKTPRLQPNAANVAFENSRVCLTKKRDHSTEWTVLLTDIPNISPRQGGVNSLSTFDDFLIPWDIYDFPKTVSI
jgi:hypothetical protein